MLHAGDKATFIVLLYSSLIITLQVSPILAIGKHNERVLMRPRHYKNPQPQIPSIQI